MATKGGYFDGDGSVRITTDSPVVLRLGLVWVDNCFDQLFQLRKFLLSEGISVGKVLKHSTNVYSLQIGSPAAAVAAAKRMIMFCFKKHRELQILVDYYEDKITGKTALSEFNELVRCKIRLGKIRKLVQLPKYSEGKYMVARARGFKGAKIANAKRSKHQNHR